MKLYTEESILSAIAISRLTNNNSFDILNQLTPIELPSNAEIQREANCFYGLESYNTTFVQGAKYVIDKIKGGTK